MTRIRCAAILVLVLVLAVPALAADATKSTYKGWESVALANGLIEVQVVPAIGGRVIQLKLGDFEYLWVNPQLAGKAPPPTGLGPKGEWLNYGGDKLWPAPQGWDNDRQWPGPPDAVLDGSPHAAAILDAKGETASLRLTSREDPRSGIQFSRVIRVFDNAARVSFDSTMKNVDTKPRRWGIWQVTQLDAGGRDGEGFNPEIRCYSPVNPKSRYERGYNQIYGLLNDPSFRVDPATGLFSAHYERRVGKVGLDNAAGWVATVDGTRGCVFVERFTHFPDKTYPDHASVEFWMNGAGPFVMGTTVVDVKDDPVETPHLVESEVLGPLVELAPGKSTSFRLDWYVARIGGKYPVLGCTEVGVTCEPLSAKAAGGKVRLAGRFGVFHPAAAQVVFLDGGGKECGKAALKAAASPMAPLVIESDESLPAEAATACLVLCDASGKVLGELARAPVSR